MTKGATTAWRQRLLSSSPASWRRQRWTSRAGRLGKRWRSSRNRPAAQMARMARTEGGAGKRSVRPLSWCGPLRRLNHAVGVVVRPNPHLTVKDSQKSFSTHRVSSPWARLSVKKTLYRTLCGVSTSFSGGMPQQGGGGTTLLWSVRLLEDFAAEPDARARNSSPLMTERCSVTSDEKPTFIVSSAPSARLLLNASQRYWRDGSFYQKTRRRQTSLLQLRHPEFFGTVEVAETGG